MSLIISVIITLIIVIYFWLKKRNNYWNERGFLQPESSSFLGVTKGKTPFQGLDDRYKDFKGRAKAIGIYQFLVPNIFLIDPDLIKHVLMKDFSYFHDRGMYHNKVG